MYTLAATRMKYRQFSHFFVFETDFPIFLPSNAIAKTYMYTSPTNTGATLAISCFFLARNMLL